MSKSPSKRKRDVERLRAFRRLRNGDVVALRLVNPHARKTRDVKSRVLYVEHLPACEAGTVIHTAAGDGLHDIAGLDVEFHSAFYEIQRVPRNLEALFKELKVT